MSTTKYNIVCATEITEVKEFRPYWIYKLFMKYFKEQYPCTELWKTTTRWLIIKSIYELNKISTIVDWLLLRYEIFDGLYMYIDNVNGYTRCKRLLFLSMIVFWY
jgi:hypothetical protein